MVKFLNYFWYFDITLHLSHLAPVDLEDCLYLQIIGLYLWCRINETEDVE